MPPAVLVAWDPAVADRSAIGFGLRVARPLGARVTVVGVRAAESLADGDGEDAPAAEQACSELASALHREADVRLLRADSAAAGLQRLIAAELPLLAVLGSSHAAALGRVALGTTAERVVHGAATAVAIVPRGADARPPGPVTLGLLPTSDGRRALSLAARLASALGARLQALLVLRRSPQEAEARELAERLAAPGGADAAAGPAERLRAAIVAAVRAEAPGAFVDPRVLIGDPVDALLRASEDGAMLVLGSRAYGPPEVVLPGGAARRLLASARCPVVLTPRAGGAATTAAEAAGPRERSGAR
jgi:nucleotide-binding universal stress UspA family protein